MARNGLPRRMPHWLILISLFVLFFAFPSALLAQGQNLLQNPGFESPFSPIPGKENCLVAVPWTAWWTNGTAEQTHEGYLLAPEFKMSTRGDYPGNRVHSGDLSQQWFHSYGNFQAGVWQQVGGIPVGAKVRFEMWAMTWSCDNEAKGNCGGATSGDPSTMHLRIGINPNGGTDPFDPAIVWSEEQNFYDNWGHLQVEAVARAHTITALVYSYPEYRSQDNNVYVDDASLVIVALPATSTPRPTNTPANTATPTDTDTPEATATPTATDTSTPTPTATPSATPTDTATPTSTDTPTSTSTPTRTNTPVPTATNTPTPTETLVPIPTATATPVPGLIDKVISTSGIWMGMAGALFVGLALGGTVRLIRKG